MSSLEKILYAVIALGICWLLYRQLKANPQWLSRDSLTKSSRVMGILALVLIAFIALCVMFLRNS